MEPVVSVTRFEDLNLSKLYTYADYLTWNFKERVELIKGKIFKMSPAPSSIHQHISSQIHGNLFSFLRGKSCLVFSAPFDVRLSANNALSEEITTVVQPDLCVICDKTKIDRRGCVGAPDLIIEILSPSNDQIEVTKKYALYETNRVKEYWIVYPYETIIQVYTLNEAGQYVTSKPYAPGGTIKSTVLEGFELEVATIFQGLDFNLM